MNFKTWWYDTKTTKWQIIIGTLLIGIFFIGTFSFLDTYQFEQWKYSGFSKSMIGILMGTVALGVITGIIIIFQSIVATDKEKNQKIWNSKKVLRVIYQDFYSIINNQCIDGNILEIGGGMGNFNIEGRTIIKTDVEHSNAINFVSDAHSLPFQDSIVLIQGTLKLK